jgi:adenosylcobinamide-GDP ribazoletransferase
MYYQLILSFLAAVSFYTIVPLPRHWPLDFGRVTRWAPGIGLLIGGGLALLDTILSYFGLPVLTRSTLVVSFWVLITGGLHLDGVIDTADGLAVMDQKRRLQVMQDSVTGAFGVMAAVLLLLLKVAALTDLHSNRCFALMNAAGWSRWGQVLAIALYPYLKPTGKGAFHKQTLRLPQDALLGLCFLFALSLLQLSLNPYRWWLVLEIIVAGAAIALGTGFWFYRQLGGHTGDSYGAVVEWTEALLICIFTGIF